MDLDTSPAVQKALMYYLASRVLDEILEAAVSATEARDWRGDTGCFPKAEKTFEETWDDLLEEGCDLSLAASKAIVEAIIQGTATEQHRFGWKWVTPVRRHIREHWWEAPTLGDATIHDRTSVGSIWDTFKMLFENQIELFIPDDLTKP